MSSSDSVHPLRISKNPTTPSPANMASGIPRALSEISPTEKRRNSPSWNQATKKMAANQDSSPFQSSPAESATSPRMFWQRRNTSTENSLYGGRTGSPSATRRSSIERLQRASRVKNSNILALEQKQEYDPTRIPHIERPLAKMQGNAFGGRGPAGLRSDGPPAPAPERRGHQRSQSKTDIPTCSPTKAAAQQESAMGVNPPRTPTKEQTSPIKSSLSTSRFRSSFDENMGSWSNDANVEPRSLHRHTKSVTFDAAPPQVNEYEMATPDLSSIGSNSREGSYEFDEDDEYDPFYQHHHDMDGQDDSFDASLEDTDKTPVVGPDEWRHDGAGRDDDPFFDSSPAPEAMTGGAMAGHSAYQRSDSASSEHRPLPPLPGMGQSPGAYSRESQSPGLSATTERMLGSPRGLPSPPSAPLSAVDVQNIGTGKMSLEERLKLMMLSDDGNAAKTAAEQQRERRLRRGGVRDRFGSPASASETDTNSQAALEAEEEEDTVGDISGLEDYQLPPRISRESILRRVDGNKAFERQSDYHFGSPAPVSSPARQLPFDPDVPIPSTEQDSILEDGEEDSVVAHENGFVDREESFPVSDYSMNEGDEVIIHEDKDIDSGSQYSGGTTPEQVTEQRLTQEPEEDVTPQASPAEKATFSSDAATSAVMGDVPVLPRPDEAGGHEVAEAQAFLQRSFTPDQEPLTKPEYDGSGWGEPEEYDDHDSDDAGSVIHHPIQDFEEEEGVVEEEEDEEEIRESPDIPEQLATVKASGSKLKTRPSATPSDLVAMREARRQVSREVPIVPPIPERHQKRLSRDLAPDVSSSTDDYMMRHPSFKKRSLTLDLDMGLSLDQDFDRVIEAQKVAFDQLFLELPAHNFDLLSGQASGEDSTSTSKTTQGSVGANHIVRKQRGYLMRQNTKLVAASDKESDDSWKARSAGNSPVKTDRPQSWTVEPWNGKQRSRSIRKRPSTAGPVPPLPGQESNATTLNPLAEEDLNPELATEEIGERGRLFIKVMGVKDLDLPISKTERTWFSLTLDNGVHCVTTAWLELARNAPIGQEFELVVPNELEFQLTLNVKLEKPAPKPIVASPTKPTKPKTSTFSRVFASPKKRREMEMRQREEEQRLAMQRDAQARQMQGPPSVYELLSPLVAEDGSFARAYVCLKEHESRCFGRPSVVEAPCFNEWATEEAGFASSVKSKRGTTAVVRRAPYKIGKLELQLLFVPRPKGTTDEDMPKSMNSCIRELKAAEERLSRHFEGHLSQQGGDCPYWRRRYFKLAGNKLTAYHEATRQPRATINLANAKRLIDDRRTLTERETTVKGGRRRRSAFAEEEEGYMFVEEGFRIRFNNGEVIDFYADTAEEKEGWMRVLSEVIGRGESGADDDTNNPRRSKWCEVILKREDALRRRAADGRRVHSRTKSMFV